MVIKKQNGEVIRTCEKVVTKEDLMISVEYATLPLVAYSEDELPKEDRHRWGIKDVGSDTFLVDPWLTKAECDVIAEKLIADYEAGKEEFIIEA